MAPDLLGPVDLHVGLPDALHLLQQLCVALGAQRAQGRAALTRGVTPVRRWGDLQDAADRLDPKLLAVLIDERLQDLMRRSSSAWAKNALASFRISLALRSSRFSRSSSLIRWASAVETPSRWPESTSCCFTQVCKVCGTQPILSAMDSMAAHCDGCYARCSSTRRTARSRTSGENFGDFFMAPFS